MEQNVTVNHLAFNKQFIQMAVPSALTFFAFMGLCGILLYKKDRPRRPCPDLEITHDNTRKPLEESTEKIMEENMSIPRVTVSLSSRKAIMGCSDTIITAEKADNAQGQLNLHVVPKKVVFSFVNRVRMNDSRTGENMFV